MIAIRLSLLLGVALTTFAGAQVRVFTDSQGRKVTAAILEANDTEIIIKRKDDGHKFTLPLDKLSDEDVKWIKEWRKQRAAAALAAERAVAIPYKLTTYCKEQAGKQVGNGECWTLADAAFKACGLKRPGRDPRVWGRLINHAKEPLRAGDVVEFRSAKFSDGSWTGPEHTAIITSTLAKGRIVVAEQNWSGVKKVHEREFDPAALTAGGLMFYRPE